MPGVSSQERRHFLAALAIILAVVGFVVVKALVRAFSPRPSEAQCLALIDRYFEHQSRARDPQLDDADVEAARQRDDPGRISDVDACTRKLTRAQVECDLGSPNVDELERCLQ